MNESEFDKLLNQALRIPIPPGLEQRLELALDAQAQQDAGTKTRKKLRYLMPIAGIAASLLICAGIFITPHKQRPRDTFTDPREAAIAAVKMLTFASEEINLGLEQVAAADRATIEYVNSVINESLNINKE